MGNDVFFFNDKTGRVERLHPQLERGDNYAGLMDSIWACSQRHSENRRRLNLYFLVKVLDLFSLHSSKSVKTCLFQSRIFCEVTFKANLKSGSLFSNQPLCLLQRHHPIKEHILEKLGLPFRPFCRESITHFVCKACAHHMELLNILTPYQQAPQSHL